MSAMREELAKTFAEAREIVKDYAEGYEEEIDLDELLDALDGISEGKFDQAENCLFELWDALGLAGDRSPMLDQLYIMLGMMKDIQIETR